MFSTPSAVSETLQNAVKAPVPRGIQKLPIMFVHSRERSPAFLLEASVERQGGVEWSELSVPLPGPGCWGL